MDVRSVNIDVFEDTRRITIKVKNSVVYDKHADEFSIWDMYDVLNSLGVAVKRETYPEDPEGAVWRQRQRKDGQDW